jgi:NADPH:quinone reductase-like Zn-dependent oxidoreductase
MTRERAVATSAAIRQASPDDLMRAVVQDEYGSADVWRLDRRVHPAMGADQVLLSVHAAGLDRGTWHLMTGKPYAGRLAFGIRRPTNPVPGLDVAGTVVAVGPKVTKFVVGDAVFGFARGALAEYAVAHPDKLAAKPARLTPLQAAAVPLSAATALQALTDIGRLEAGQTVLVVGASGGVGSYAVQIAVALGGSVTAVCGPGKAEMVRSLGADHVVDYTREDFAEGGHRYDLVLDIGGNPSVSRLRRALTRSGTAVIVGGEQGGDLTGGMHRQLGAVALSPFVRQRLTMFIAKHRASDLDRLTDLIESGAVAPHIDRTYPLAQAPEAMRYLAAGMARGKVVVTI